MDMLWSRINVSAVKIIIAPFVLLIYQRVMLVLRVWSHQVESAKTKINAKLITVKFVLKIIVRNVIVDIRFFKEFVHRGPQIARSQITKIKICAKYVKQLITLLKKVPANQTNQYQEQVDF